MPNRDSAQLQLELPDYSEEYIRYINKNNLSEKEKQETVIIIEI